MDHITSYDIEMNVKIVRESIQELAQAVKSAISSSASDGFKEANKDLEKKVEDGTKKETALDKEWQKFLDKKDEEKKAIEKFNKQKTVDLWKLLPDMKAIDIEDLISKFPDLSANEIADYANKMSDKSYAQFEKFTESSSKELSQFAQKEITSLVDTLITQTKNLFKDAWQEMNNMLDYFKMSNASTRETRLTYGFSASEAYGFDKAMSMLGYQSEEDLYYAGNKELAEFKEAFEKYSDYYTKLAESGYFEELQEFNFEWEDFKMEIQQKLISFFIENKDSIKAGMEAIISILNVVTKIVGFFTSSNGTATTSDILNKYNQTTTNSNVSISISNNNAFNNIDNDGAVNNAIGSSNSTLYRQIITALQGGE